MNLDGREITVFNAAKSLLEEIEVLKEDLKQLRADAEENGLSKERIGDLIAVAKDAITDQLKRERKDAQRRRRAELEGQLSLLPDKTPREPRKAAAPQPEPPHDPEAGEVIEDRDAPHDQQPALQEGDVVEWNGATHVLERVDLTDVEPVAFPEPAAEDTFALDAARRSAQADDLEIPTFARRGHPDCALGRVPEAAE